MKEIKSDKILELRLRIYDSRFMERLNDIFQGQHNLWKNKNEFFVNLLRQGLEQEEIALQNARALIEKSTILEKLDLIHKVLENLIKVGLAHFREDFVSGRENITLLQRLYNLAWRKIDDDYLEGKYNSGLFDCYPKDFVQVQEFARQEFKIIEKNIY